MGVIWLDVNAPILFFYIFTSQYNTKKMFLDQMLNESFIGVGMGVGCTEIKCNISWGSIHHCQNSPEFSYSPELAWLGHVCN